MDAFVRSQMFQTFLEEVALGAPNAVNFDEHIVARRRGRNPHNKGLTLGHGQGELMLGRFKKSKKVGAALRTRRAAPSAAAAVGTGAFSAISAANSTPFLDEDRDPSETFLAPQPSGRGLPQGHTFGLFRHVFRASWTQHSWVTCAHHDGYCLKRCCTRTQVAPRRVM